MTRIQRISLIVAVRVGYPNNKEVAGYSYREGRQQHSAGDLD
jgi:hypothetical protein